MGEIEASFHPQSAAEEQAAHRYAIEALRDRRLQSYRQAVEFTTIPLKDVDPPEEVQRWHDGVDRAWTRRRQLSDLHEFFVDDDAVDADVVTPYRAMSLHLRQILGVQDTTIDDVWDSEIAPQDELAWHAALVLLKFRSGPDVVAAIAAAVVVAELDWQRRALPERVLTARRLLNNDELTTIEELDARRTNQRLKRLKELDAIRRLTREPDKTD